MPKYLLGNILMLIIIGLSFLIITPFILLIYLLGHVIPALILTKEDVHIFIGFSKKREQQYIIEFYRMNIYISKNPIYWTNGSSRINDESLSRREKILVILIPPIITLMFGIITCYYLFNHFEDGRIIFVGFVILLSALIKTYANSKAIYKAIQSNSGNLAYNYVKGIWRRHTEVKKRFDELIFLVEEKKYFEAASLYKELGEEKLISNEDVLKEVINLYLLIDKYDTALDFFNEKSSQVSKEVKKEVAVRLKKFKIRETLYLKLNEFLQEKKYAEARLCCENIITEEGIHTWTFNTMLFLFFYLKEYKMGKIFFDKFHLDVEKDALSYGNIGLIYSILDDKRSIEMYNKALAINPNDVNVLNNRGFQNNTNGNYQDAIHDFDKAITIDSNAAYPLSNRGFSKIHLGLEEEGLEDVKASLAIDDQNSYAYRTLGIYFIKKGDRENALKNLNLALELDDGTFKIQHLIKEAEQM